MKKIIILTYILLQLCTSDAQTKPMLEVGKPMPDFVLNDVHYYNKSSVSLKDFRGKWLMLDFWNRHCYFCIASHPRIDGLQKLISNDKIQIILIGYSGSQYLGKSDEVEIKLLHEKQRYLHGLSLPIAYDSTLFHSLDIKPTPYVIIIDPEGIVKGVTTDISYRSLLNLMEGEQVILEPALTLKETKANRKKSNEKTK